MRNMAKVARLGVMLVLTVWAGAALAASSVTQKATGYGATPQDATANALVNAARQAMGVAVTVNPDFRQQTLEWVVHQNQNGYVITQQWSDAPEPRLPTLAGITSYRVSQLSQVNDMLWKAKVEANIAQRKVLRPKRSELFSVVVLPVASQQTAYPLREVVPASSLQQLFHESLVEHLTQSKQVRVLDRAHLSQRLAEQLLSASSLDASERAKLGHQVGADMVLATRIDRFRLGREGGHSYGDSTLSLALHARLHYRLISVATGDILRADTIHYDPPAQQVSTAVQQAGISLLDAPDRLRDVIVPMAARAIVNPVLNEIQPLQILKVVDDQHIFVSQGAGRLIVGDLLAVTQSTALTNPQTGMTFAAHTPTDINLVVTQVAPGYAVARLTAGRLNEVSKGQAVAVQPAPEKPASETHPMTPGSSAAPLNWN